MYKHLDHHLRQFGVSLTAIQSSWNDPPSGWMMYRRKANLDYTLPATKSSASQPKALSTRRLAIRQQCASQFAPRRPRIESRPFISL